MPELPLASASGTAAPAEPPPLVSRPPKRAKAAEGSEYITPVGKFTPGVHLVPGNTRLNQLGLGDVLVPQTPGELEAAVARQAALERAAAQQAAGAAAGLGIGLGARNTGNWMIKNPPTTAAIASLMAAVRALGPRALLNFRNVTTALGATGFGAFAVRVTPLVLQVGAVGFVARGAVVQAALFEQAAQNEAAFIAFGGDTAAIGPGLGALARPGPAKPSGFGADFTASSSDTEEANETNGPAAPGANRVVTPPMGGHDP